MKPFLPLSAVNDSGTTTITITIYKWTYFYNKCHESLLISWVGWFTAYLANVFLTKLQGLISARKKAQVNLELDEHCHEHYEPDSKSENEIEIESVPETSNETVTTSEFLKHLSSVRTYIQSRGASENIHNSLHDLERIGIQDQIENSGKKQTKITTFFK